MGKSDDSDQYLMSAMVTTKQQGLYTPAQNFRKAGESERYVGGFSPSKCPAPPFFYADLNLGNINFGRKKPHSLF